MIRLNKNVISMSQGRLCIIIFIIVHVVLWTITYHVQGTMYNEHIVYMNWMTKYTRYDWVTLIFIDLFSRLSMIPTSSWSDCRERLLDHNNRKWNDNKNNNSLLERIIWSIRRKINRSHWQRFRFGATFYLILFSTLNRTANVACTKKMWKGAR